MVAQKLRWHEILVKLVWIFTLWPWSSLHWDSKQDWCYMLRHTQFQVLRHCPREPTAQTMWQDWMADTLQLSKPFCHMTQWLIENSMAYHIGSSNSNDSQRSHIFKYSDQISHQKRLQGWSWLQIADPSWICDLWRRQISWQTHGGNAPLQPPCQPLHWLPSLSASPHELLPTGDQIYLFDRSLSSAGTPLAHVTRRLSTATARLKFRQCSKTFLVSHCVYQGDWHGNPPPHESQPSK